MRFLSKHAFIALTLLITTSSPAVAVIMKLTPLAEVLENDDFIFVATLEKSDPERPAAVFKVEKVFKGKPPYDRIPVNMTGNAEAQKAGDPKTILERLAPERKVIFFVGKRGKNHNAKVFVEGSWFSVAGSEDPADKTVRWAFQNGEPFLRRTFNGTSAEMIQVIEDGLAKKAKPPQPDEKEKPGYGPPVAKKCYETEQPCSAATDQLQDTSVVVRTRNALPLRASHEPKPAAFEFTSCGPRSTLFGVIPSLALIGPMAALAALFPGVFARLAIGMKRWRAFLVVASINSTLALLYWAVITYWPSIVPQGWWFGVQAFTIYLTCISAIGLLWAGRRYRRMAAENPAVTNLPGRSEIAVLAGGTVFAGVSALLVGVFAEWRANLEIPMREFTFIGIGLLATTLYAGYRYLTSRVDSTGQGQTPDRRLSVSGESVGLATLVLCGLITVLTMNNRNVNVMLAIGTEVGDADTIGPRFLSVKAFEIPRATQVLSGISAAGDRLYFGTQFVRSSQEGQIVCMDRETGEVQWKFEGNDDLLPVFCTPMVRDGKVYCGEGLHENKDCRMFCLNATDGKPAWANPFQTQSHTEGTPEIIGGTIYFPAGDDGLIAAHANTGEEKWRFKGGKEAGIHIDAAPATDGSRVFVGSGLYSYVAVALDAESGQERWRTNLNQRAFGAPLVLGKLVYFGVGTGNMGADVHNYHEEGDKKESMPGGAIVCLEAENGKEVWRFDLSRSVHTGLTGDAFTVYAAARDGYVYALDRKTGQLRWKTGIGGAVTSKPAVATAGGIPVAVYAVSREGLAVALNPQSGKILWQKQLPGYQWDGREANGVLSGPTVVSTATPTGSKRAIYIGAMTVDPNNPTRKTAAVFRFDDEIGGE